MDLQKINWKVFLDHPEAVKPHDFFKAFGTWIPDSPEVFVDVVDYAHVPEGPVTFLAGHHVDYSLDRTDGKLGLLFAQKTPLTGTDADKLALTLKSLLAAAKRLEADPIFGGNLHFGRTRLELIINDRAIAPNTPETFARLEPAIKQALAAVFGHDALTLKYLDEPKKRIRVACVMQKPILL